MRLVEVFPNFLSTGGGGFGGDGDAWGEVFEIGLELLVEGFGRAVVEDAFDMFAGEFVFAGHF